MLDSGQRNTPNQAGFRYPRWHAHRFAASVRNRDHLRAGGKSRADRTLARVRLPCRARAGRGAHLGADRAARVERGHRWERARSDQSCARHLRHRCRAAAGGAARRHRHPGSLRRLRDLVPGRSLGGAAAGEARDGHRQPPPALSKRHLGRAAAHRRGDRPRGERPRAGGRAARAGRRHREAVRAAASEAACLDGRVDRSGDDRRTLDARAGRAGRRDAAGGADWGTRPDTRPREPGRARSGGHPGQALWL